MGDVTTLDMVRGLYDYHWWANRRLFDVAAGLGEEATGRDVGTQFSFPTLRRLLAHIYGADAIWLSRWKGQSLTALPGADVRTVADLRQRWDGMEQDQRAFIQALAPTDLARVIEYKNTEGTSYRAPLWPLLQHVANHATHHRSEAATMIIMISGSPPDTGLVTHYFLVSHQGDMGRRWA